jgi:hypothetical protein
VRKDWDDVANDRRIGTPIDEGVGSLIVALAAEAISNICGRKLASWQVGADSKLGAKKLMTQFLVESFWCLNIINSESLGRLGGVLGPVWPVLQASGNLIS